VKEPPDFVNRQPDISQSEAGNRSAEEIIARDARNQRIVVNEIVLTPHGCPGEDKKENPQFQAKYDVYYG
jgi:hypothetical protein